MDRRSKSYIIDLPPVAWQRPGQNGNVRYDAQKNPKLLFGLHINKEHNNERPFTTPISIDIVFSQKYPKSKSKKLNLIWWDTTPDIDNLEKFLYDTLQECGVIANDKLIVQVSQKKIYSDRARVEFTITEL